ncbi:MAG TPA: hypothetical protein VHH88_07905 [Verrucomicrobiae bacterium]|nr:hypothetical protein [Verrucomicrobiae bacterium]
MKTLLSISGRAWKAAPFSPRAFIIRAALISLAFCACEIAGLREYTSFLSGTSANLNLSWQTGATLGLIHLLLYVAFILLAPVFLITAGLLSIWNRWKRPAEARPTESNSALAATSQTLSR